MDFISQLLSTDGYITVNKTLIKKFGLHSAVILGELCREYNYWKNDDKLVDGAFYSTRENIEENTGLNEHFQRKALTELKEQGVVLIVKKGLPAVNYYTINFDKLLKILTSSSEKYGELEVKSVEINKNKENKNKEKEKPIIKNTVKFDFGSQQPQKATLWDNCVNLINSFNPDPVLRSKLIEVLKQFLDNSREAGKPFYTNNFKGKLNNLKRLADDHGYMDVQYAIQVIQQTLDKGWNDFYDIKQTNSKPVSTDMDRHSVRMTQEQKEQSRRAIEDGTIEKF